MYAFVLMLLSALSSAICRSTAVELCNRCGNGHDRFTFSEVCYILSEIGFILTSCFCSQMSAPVEITDPDLLNIAKVDLAMATVNAYDHIGWCHRSSFLRRWASWQGDQYHQR
jgi:hypothetical protein